MTSKPAIHHIRLQDMKHQTEWKALLSLAKKMDDHGIQYKADGKTMIFAHGLEFQPDKLHFTFKWGDEQKILDFFGEKGPAIPYGNGFKYFDTKIQGMKVRCMFYAVCPGDDADALFYRNTDRVEIDGQVFPAQTVAFYLQNGEPGGDFYRQVEEWHSKRQ